MVLGCRKSASACGTWRGAYLKRISSELTSFLGSANWLTPSPKLLSISAQVLRKKPPNGCSMLLSIGLRKTACYGSWETSCGESGTPVTQLLVSCRIEHVGLAKRSGESIQRRGLSR